MNTVMMMIASHYNWGSANLSMNLKRHRNRRQHLWRKVGTSAQDLAIFFYVNSKAGMLCQKLVAGPQSHGRQLSISKKQI